MFTDDFWMTPFARELSGYQVQVILRHFDGNRAVDEWVVEQQLAATLGG